MHSELQTLKHSRTVYCFGEKILVRMCHDAVETMDRQCGREYGFTKFQNEKPRATQVLFQQN